MKCGNRIFVGNDDDDRISQLPDEILVSILSLLSLKEAGRTSVLSSRWINLWKHTHSLNFFDQTASLPFISKRHKYLKWVNSVLQLHKSPTLKLFRIGSLLGGSDSNSITEWLKFAFSRHVQTLELDYSADFSKNCFPEELLAPGSTMQLSDFKSLKSLSLKSVQVSGGAVEFFLRNCPLLEKLIVHWSEDISKLEICGSSLVLKHLEIMYCNGLESLIVSAPTLASLRVTSLKGVMLDSVPLLVDLSVTCEDIDISMTHVVSVLSCCNTQLETLHLSLMRCHVQELSYFPEMPKLKKLFIEYGFFEQSLIKIASLTRASPYLQEFVFKNKLYESPMARGEINDAAGSLKFRHEHIKVFKFCGYKSRPFDDALLEYILENCVVLEKIILEPSGEYWHDMSGKLHVEEPFINIAKRHLRVHPKVELPHQVELAIL